MIFVEIKCYILTYKVGCTFLQDTLYNWIHYKTCKCEAEKGNKTKRLCKTDFRQ